ncbi:MarR family winged helix-turn-helix transcriptional regulator [Streptomyces sp. HUCO-GS316]|uniref:MarR family winged helix-turn-helix transcriptional regulator n=1 Tax=Streptomyces sp. HUCO-GS316 TaxID=2692198 RepID=UPI001F25EC65|nr:MarR family winged helix-turn-helix transcriptional regulator [Streptomyces sp. HUCO-GS316]
MAAAKTTGPKRQQLQPSELPCENGETRVSPDPALEEWPTPETGAAADIESTVIGRLMGRDAFAHHGLGSSALVIIGPLHARPAQTIGELVGSASVSRAIAHRALRRLADHACAARRRRPGGSDLPGSCSCSA